MIVAGTSSIPLATAAEINNRTNNMNSFSGIIC